MTTTVTTSDRQHRATIAHRETIDLLAPRRASEDQLTRLGPEYAWRRVVVALASW